MNAIPWLELAILIPLVGAAAVLAVRDPAIAWRWCLAFAGATFGCALAASAGFYSDGKPAGFIDRSLIGLDELNAPLGPLVALLHVLIVLATPRIEMDRFAFAGLLGGLAIRLAAIASLDGGVLVAMLAIDATLPLVDSLRGGRSSRVYLLHMVPFVLLLVAGWATASEGLLILAILIRCGTIPVHIWLTDTCERSSFGSAVLHLIPLLGVNAAVRLLVPIASEEVLYFFAIIALVTALYAAGLSLVQVNPRRFLAFQFVALSALVLAGIGLHSVVTIMGALALWVSGTVALGGVGLILRAVEARVGPLDLADFRGLYDQAPALAIGFLLAGLASVGFPLTFGFAAAEVLVDGALSVHVAIGVVLVLSVALNGIAFVRVYLLLFTGKRHATGVPLGITPRERIAVLVLAAIILVGGLVPQPFVTSRSRAAEFLLHNRVSDSTTLPSR